MCCWTSVTSGGCRSGASRWNSASGCAARREGASTGPALRRVTTLLGNAHEALTRLATAERSDTAFGYTERQLLFHEGDTRVMLGDHRGAEKAFTWSLDLYAPDEILDR